MIIVLWILGGLVYLVIGRVVANWISNMYNEDWDDVMAFTIILWPFVVIYNVSQWIGDLINGRE